ncbi:MULTISPECIES: DUF4190 domain-containing protein [unclassified Streptomyces]|uniref:DUF4190 domain-containing protein n=1 Tax=unclassified Streptomyces TaxID=2593676 RepID=UPI002DD85552|nr:DUF4190 domain-containing protein [Streptomyces sp. NBC_01750]WSB00543.1 DUF4190 domain-containing protein [Streptomyces sp. NBC_01794]WSD35100.1 DUF4190 domain-containing protein [Streptomyces sp. NBC_01750]
MDPSAQSWQPYPQYARRPSVNGLSVASLVLGIVCCLPPLGLVLGLIALSQIKRKGQRGKGMAVAGIVLSSISTLLVLVAFATGGIGDAWDGFRKGMDEASRSRSTLDLHKGDCFNVPGDELERETASVRVVDCAKEHDAEVTGAFKLGKSDAWPGEAAVEPVAEKRCTEINNAYAANAPAVPDSAETYYYMPSRRSWRLGDRTVTCTFAVTEGKLKGSVRSGGIPSGG